MFIRRSHLSPLVLASTAFGHGLSCHGPRYREAEDELRAIKIEKFDLSEPVFSIPIEPKRKAEFRSAFEPNSKVPFPLPGKKRR